jgi:hypothetical protein
MLWKVARAPRIVLAALSAVVAGGLVAIVLWSQGEVQVGTSPHPPRSAGAVERPSPDPSRPVTGVPRYACTVARRNQAILNRVGPFCLPPDAIPAIDRPAFQLAGKVDFLSDQEPVMAVVLGGEARAYPLRILVWHEVVNDRLGSTPVVVTFCPLCNSGVAFERTLGGRVLTFAVSGQLRGPNLVMFDRETETLWQQLTGEAERGALEGRRLRMVASRIVPFEEFKATWPDGRVMTEKTGHVRPYGDDPYAGYGVDRHEESVFMFGANVDPRLPPKARILGILSGGTRVAVPYPVSDGRRRVVEIGTAEGAVAVLLEHGVGLQGTAPSFEGQHLGWTGAAYRARLVGRPLDLVARSTGFLDRRTGTVFDVTGVAVRGPLLGRRLRPVISVDSYWFAWAFFHPHTEVVRPG